jgi:hypothetical protein
VSDRGDPDNCGAPGVGCAASQTSATQTFTITVNPVNDAPVLTSNGGGATASLSVSEGTTPVTDVDATDADLPPQTLTYSIGGADAALFAIDSVTGVLSFLAPPVFLSPADADGNNVYEVRVQVFDGSLADTQDLSVSVTQVFPNQPPTIISNGGGNTASASVVENTLAVADVDATDPNPGDTLTYALAGGADAGRFQIDGTTGVLSFTTAADFEAPADANGDNVYEVVVSVSDGLLDDTQALSVSVTDANESPVNKPPVITSAGGAATAELQVNEGTTGVTTVEASDPEGALVAYAISGGADAALFNLNPVSGALSFVSAPDVENPVDANGDNAYEVTVQASDGVLTDVQALAIRVLDVNEGPKSNLPSGLATDEDVALVLGSALRISDPEGAASAVRVTLSITRGTVTVARRNGLTFEQGNGTANQSMTFTGSLAAANAALDGLVFTPAPDAYGLVTLTLTSADPLESDLSDTSSTVIIVRPVNDAPALAPISDIQAQAGTAVGFGVSASDVDGPELTYSLAGAPAGARIDPATGAFTWTPSAAQAPGTYTFEVVVNDGGTPRLTDRTTVTIMVTISEPATLPPAPPPGDNGTPPPGAGPGGSPSTATPPLQARNDSARATSPTAVTIVVLGNDVFPTGSRVTVSAGPARHGTVRVLPDGSIVYTPEPGFEGTDRFPYTIVGADGRRSSAEVEVVVALPSQTASSWIGGPLLEAAAASRQLPTRVVASLHTGFLAMARALLETLQGLDTPVRLLAVAGAWVGLFGFFLLVFRRRRAFLVDGVSRGEVLQVLDRPEGECLFRLRFDEGPVWSVGRRRRVHGRIWVPVRTRSGRGFVEIDRLLAIDSAVDSPRTVLQG